MTAAGTITTQEQAVPTVLALAATVAGKRELEAAGWVCIGAGTLPGGPTVYWLQHGGAA